MKTTQKPHCHQRSGFTLVELMAVVAIIAILATIGVAGYSHFTKVSQEKKAGIQLNLLSSAIQDFAKDNNGKFPSNDSGFGEFIYSTYPIGAEKERRPFDDKASGLLAFALGGRDKDDGGDEDKVYLTDLSDKRYDKQGLLGDRRRTFLIDPWGNPWGYRPAEIPQAQTDINPDFDLWSAGPDGIDNTVDDVANF